MVHSGGFNRLCTLRCTYHAIPFQQHGDDCGPWASYNFHVCCDMHKLHMCSICKGMFRNEYAFCVPAYLCWAVALLYFTTQLFEIVHAWGNHSKRCKTGKMQCVTSMAMLQNIHRRLPGRQFSSEVNVHSPAQMLPKTNWSTIQGRMQRWMVWGGCGVGKCRDNVAQDVSNALSTVSWSPRARMTGTVRSSSP